ncbi:MAG: hypothetical protein ACYDH5_05545 [Acidimicrobiales bacterium]
MGAVSLGDSSPDIPGGLVDEYWRAAAVAAVVRYREADPQGWSDSLAEADALSAADAPIADYWERLAE